LNALEAELKIDEADEPGSNVEHNLQGLTVLYIGGRPRIDQPIESDCRKEGRHGAFA